MSELPKAPQLSREKRRELAAPMRSLGFSAPEIGKILGLTVPAVYYQWERNIYSRQQFDRRARKTTLEQRQSLDSRIKELAEEGITNYEEISELLNIDIGLVRQSRSRLIKNGDIPKVVGNKGTVKESTKTRLEQVCIMRQNGQSIREIAEQLGKSETTISFDVARLKKAGLLPQQSSRSRRKTLFSAKEEKKRTTTKGKVSTSDQKKDEVLTVPKRLFTGNVGEITQEIRQKMYDLYNRRVSVEKIAKEFQIPFVTAARIISDCMRAEITGR